MSMRIILPLLALVIVSGRLEAAAIQPAIWYNVQSLADNSVIGGVAGTGFSAPGASPWTFTLIGNATLEFTDADFVGDSYRVFNNGAALNTSPANSNFTGQSDPFNPATNCGLDPAACFADTRFSNEVFTLAGALGTNFSLTFTAVDNPLFGSNAFFRVVLGQGASFTSSMGGTTTSGGGTTTSGGGTTIGGGGGGEVPEPSTYALVGASLAWLAYARRKKA
jgi:uncharacterized membrane protein YgcG